MNRQERDLLTVAEVAEYLGLCPTQVGNLYRAGRLPSIRIGVKPGTGARRIEVGDLREFVRANREGIAA